MKDRQPYPGKEGMVKLTLTNGQVLEGKLEMADDPLEPGDPLNKATLLKDATAALFGLGSDAVPDDVLAYLGKYAMHWWRRRKVSEIVLGSAIRLESGNSLPEDTLYDTALTRGQDGSFFTVKYYESCGADDSGGIVLPTPETLQTSYNLYQNGELEKAKGKYCRSVNGRLLKIGDNAEPKRGRDNETSHYWTWMSPVYPVDAKGYQWEYVQSTLKSTYPENGVKDGYYYQYIGIPFDNAVTVPKVATGSYVGTGKYGPDNPNSLTFDGNPQMVVVSIVSELGCAGAYPDYFDGWEEGNFMWVKGATYSGGYRGIIDILETEHGISWNADDNEDARTQCNEAGKTYKYFAIVN